MLTAAAAAAFWIGALVRLRPAITHPEKRPLCFALLALASGAMFDIDPFYAWFDRVVGVTNLSDLMAHGFGLVGVYFLLRTLDGLAEAEGFSPGSSRWLRPGLFAALTLSAIFFATTPMTVETSAFTATYGSRPTVAVYWSISIAFPAVCLVQLLRTSLANWRSPVPELRIGLRLVAAGTVLGFLYAALKIAEVVAQTTSPFDLAAAVRPVDITALGLGLLFIASGLAATSPAIAGRVAGLAQTARDWYLVQRLAWLWTTLCIRAAAADVLDLSSVPAARRDLQRLRLVRRVIEIRDATATLWSYLSAEDVDHLRSSVRAASETQLEAAGLALALRRELAGASGERRIATPPMALQPSMAIRSRPLHPEQEARELVVLSRRVRKALRNVC